MEKENEKTEFDKMVLVGTFISALIMAGLLILILGFPNMPVDKVTINNTNNTQLSESVIYKVMENSEKIVALERVKIEVIAFLLAVAGFFGFGSWGVYSGMFKGLKNQLELESVKIAKEQILKREVAKNPKNIQITLFNDNDKLIFNNIELELPKIKQQSKIFSTAPDYNFDGCNIVVMQKDANGQVGRDELGELYNIIVKHSDLTKFAIIVYPPKGSMYTGDAYTNMQRLPNVVFATSCFTIIQYVYNIFDRLGSVAKDTPTKV